MKQRMKSLDDYACDLLTIAPPDVVQQFFQYMADGKRIQATMILHKFQLIEEIKK